jgi:signal transduction histidine kinase
LAQALKKQTDELQRANDALEAYARELERTADVRVREKLMQELHNRLGHLLTIAAVGVQAAQTLAATDSGEANRRLDTAAVQIRTAMQALRDVIRGQKETADDAAAFSDVLTRLVEETKKHAGIQIEQRIGPPARVALDALGAAERTFFYNALMEGLTNGIRHGGATALCLCLPWKTASSAFCCATTGGALTPLCPALALGKCKRTPSALARRLFCGETAAASLKFFCRQAVIPGSRREC